MKTFIATVVFVISSNSLIAQSFIEFPDSNTSWIMAYQEDYDYNFQIEYSNASYFDMGDTIINGFKYRKAYENSGFDVTYLAAYRKVSADTIMIVPKDSSTEFLLYDFSIHEGDTITVYSYKQYYGGGLVTIPCAYINDSVLLNDNLFKEFVFNGLGLWYSGIGGLGGPFSTDYLPYLGGYPFIQCVTIDGNIVFNPYNQCFAVGLNQEDVELGFQISPSPASSYINIVYTAEHKANLTITNAYGIAVKQLTLYPYFKNRIVYVDDLAEGIYLVTLREGDRVSSEKIIVQR